MKIAISTYTFNPSLKQINLSSQANFKIERLLAIINATADQIIYTVGTSGKSFVSESAGLVTLEYDTTTMSASDKLLILYEDESAIQKTKDDSLNALTQEIKTMNETIEGTLEAIESLVMGLHRLFPVPDINGRSTVRLSAIDGSLTLANVSNISNMVGGNMAQLPYNLAPAAYLYDKIVIT